MENRAHPLTPEVYPTENDILDWLQLSRSENVGPLTFSKLLSRYGTARQALDALPELAQRGGLKRPLKLALRSDVEKERDAVEKFGAAILTREDPRYPPLLQHIESTPPLLTVKGRLDLLQTPLFAIVGARNASLMGKRVAHEIAKNLGQYGWGIASGLARGIDAAAHEGSLGSGTVAALAGGIDQIYPQENTKLYEQIGELGVLVAESPFGTQPQSILFPRRNRVISGLSRATLVVEAALKSGSLLTAQYALEQGRDVFAVPGHPFDPRARGCNKLIKNGATLVESVEDILPLSPFRPSTFSLSEEGFEEQTVFRTPDEIRRLLQENLSFVPISIDDLLRECQLSTSELWLVCLEMEIAGKIERHSGGKIALKEEWNQT